MRIHYYCISNYGNIYDNEYLSYNIHNLIHLTKDVDNFGSLVDNFSCFKYENYMQKIKNKLHYSGKPLEELANPLFEEFKLPIKPYNMKIYPIVIYRKNNEIAYLQFETFKIIVNKTDNCALLHNMSVVSILKIVEENEIIFVHAKRFLNL